MTDDSQKTGVTGFDENENCDVDVETDGAPHADSAVAMAAPGSAVPVKPTSDAAPVPAPSAASQPPARREVAATLGKYRLFATIGSGGMAEVFLGVAAGALGSDKLVVVKRLRANLAHEDENFLRMFVDEARLAVRLSHPNIVHTYEVGNYNGMLFMAMEYLEGQSIKRIVEQAEKQKEHVPIDIAVRIVADALAGLHYAHELKDYSGKSLCVIHRDISPHNILVTYDGTVKIVDFGIAKATLNSTHTEIGTFKGKPGYMSPEQAVMSDYDRRADIFSMGVVLFELVTGTRLFPGDAVLALHRLVSMPIPLASSLVPEVDRGLDEIIEKALRRKPEERYSTAHEMRKALDAWLRARPSSTETAEVSRYVSEMFQSVREKIQRRIEAQMTATAAATAPTVSVTGLSMISGDTFTETNGMTPPRIDLDSFGRIAASQSQMSPIPSRSRRAAFVSAAAAVLAVGVAVGIVARSEKKTGEIGRTELVAPAAARPALAEAPQVAIPHAPVFVTIVSDPQGATLQWNGRALGVTPATVELTPGSQTLTLSKDGFATSTVTVDVPESSSQPLLRSASLKPTVAKPAGPTHFVSVAPPRAAPAAPRPRAATPEPAVAAAAPPPATPPAATADAPKHPVVTVIDEPKTRVRSLDLDPKVKVKSLD